MGDFWTCGPFKEQEEKAKRSIFKIEQQVRLQEILTELASLEKMLENTEDPEMKKIITITIDEVHGRLNILLGVPDA